jgi:hypothetical protein
VSYPTYCSIVKIIVFIIGDHVKLRTNGLSNFNLLSMRIAQKIDLTGKEQSTLTLFAGVEVATGQNNERSFQPLPTPGVPKLYE